MRSSCGSRHMPWKRSCSMQPALVLDRTNQWQGKRIRALRWVGDAAISIFTSSLCPEHRRLLDCIGAKDAFCA